MKLELEETDLERIFFQLWGHVNRQDSDQRAMEGGWGNPKSRIDTENEKGVPSICFWDREKLFKVNLFSPYIEPCLQLTKLYDFHGEVYHYEFFRTNGGTSESNLAYGCSHPSVLSETFLDLDCHSETLISESRFLSKCRNLAETGSAPIEIPVCCTLHMRNENASLNRIVEFFFNRFMVKEIGIPPSSPHTEELAPLSYS